MTHVIFDSETKLVKGFCEDEEPPVADGCDSGSIEQTILHWPLQEIKGTDLYFKNGCLVWEDARTIEEARLAKNAEINAAKYAADQTSFTFSGKEIQADPHSMLQIQSTNGIILLTGVIPTVAQSWKTLDNQYVSLPDIATWTQFYEAMVMKGAANHVKAQALKSQLAAAVTKEDIGKIKWT